MTKSDEELLFVDEDLASEGNDEVLDELEKSLEIEGANDSQDKSIFVSQREIISIIFSKKTLYHVLVLFILLSIFGIISYTKSDLDTSLNLIFGYGCSFVYFLTAALNRFEEVKNLSRSKSFTSLILPISLSLVCSSFFWAALNNETYGDNVERFLTW